MNTKKKVKKIIPGLDHWTMGVYSTILLKSVDSKIKSYEHVCSKCFIITNKVDTCC